MSRTEGKIHPSTGSCADERKRATPFAAAFLWREDGTFTIFGVYILLIMLLFSGIGIDLMRFERDRAELQYTLDRAVLAAVDIENKDDPKAVVQEYFAKAGFADKLTSVTVKQGLSYREVAATALSRMDTQFMHMTGVDSLGVPAASTAEERIDGVEISLVLDVSGSMNRNDRLTNLKVAAKQFVDQMVDKHRRWQNVDLDCALRHPGQPARPPDGQIQRHVREHLLKLHQFHILRLYHHRDQHGDRDAGNHAFRPLGRLGWPRQRSG